MKIGDTVKIIGSKSIPDIYTGWTGKITDYCAGKYFVELIPRKGGVGSLTHTALPDDLEVIEEGG